MKRIALSIILLLAGATLAAAQTDFGGVARFNTTVHDFGRIDIKDGAVSCSFSVTNIAEVPLNIQAVISSCGCTTATWTRSDIAPGASGTIEVSFTNDEGPYPFDKALRVYLSGLDKPVVIHIKGIAYSSRKKAK